MENTAALTERRNRNLFTGFFSPIPVILLSVPLCDHPNPFLKFAGPVCVLAMAYNMVGCWRRAAAADAALLEAASTDFVPIVKSQRKVARVEDRLDELERLKRRDMVTPEEYAAKRQEILGGL